MLERSVIETKVLQTSCENNRACPEKRVIMWLQKQAMEGFEQEIGVKELFEGDASNVVCACVCYMMHATVGDNKDVLFQENKV